MSNSRKNTLIEAGIDVDGAIEILCGDEEVLETVLNIFLEDENFTKLYQAIKNEDYQNAFYAAHTLKGVFSNLCMYNLQKICVNLVEKLRINDYDGVDLIVEEMKLMYDEICSVIKQEIGGMI